MSVIQPNEPRKNKLWRLHIGYLACTILLFITEVLIALFVDDRFIRPYFGDFLVVMLVYCFVRSFLKTPVVLTAIAVLLFAFAIETAQYFQVAYRLGVTSKFWTVVLGSSFSWSDMLAYTLGIIAVIAIEKTGKISDV